MGLKVYNHMEQRSDEWYEARRGIVTASVVGQLITAKTLKVAANPESRSLTRRLVAERISGRVEPEYASYAMEYGAWIEPTVRDLYSEHCEPATTCGFMVRESGGVRIGYSPDGVVGTDGLIEIKSREPKEQLDVILADEVPAANMAQLQCGLLVSGRQWIDYVSYCGGWPLYVKRIEPDVRWQAAILEAVEAVEDAATDMIARYSAAVEGMPMTEHIEYETEMVI